MEKWREMDMVFMMTPADNATSYLLLFYDVLHKTRAL